MDSTKNWYESKAVWGAVATIATAGLKVSGIDLGAGAEAQIADTLLTLVGGLGGGLALWGRLTATAAIARGR